MRKMKGCLYHNLSFQVFRFRDVYHVTQGCLVDDGMDSTLFDNYRNCLEHGTFGTYYPVLTLLIQEDSIGASTECWLHCSLLCVQNLIGVPNLFKVQLRVAITFSQTKRPNPRNLHGTRDTHRNWATSIVLTFVTTTLSRRA